MSEKSASDAEVVETDALTEQPEAIEMDHSSDDAEIEAETQPEPNSNEPAPKNGRPLAMAALAVSVVALIGVGAGGWMAGQQVSQAQSANGDLAADIAALQANVESLQTLTAPVTELQTNLARVDAAQQQVLDAAAQATETSDAVQQQLTRFVSDLSDTRTRIELIEGNRAQEYLLAEVEYLLRIAIQRVQAGGDVRTGLALMESADQTLARADDAALFPVRRALASEVAALKAVPSVDRNGMYLALAAAADQVDALSIAPAALSQAEAPEATTADGMLKTLSSFITVRQRSEPIEPMLSPAESVYARQNLRLMIEQAQLAILSGDQAAWQSSLQRATEWADRHFLSSDAVTQSLVTTLAELAEQEVAPELPAVGASLSALKKVQQARVSALGSN